MSSIPMVKANERTQDTAWIASTDKASRDDNELFSEILQKLKSVGTSSGDDTENSSEAMQTVTRIMPDGTLRITVYRGSEIISQTESSPTVETEKPAYLENQSGSVSDSVNQIASSSAATLMLNMLMQK